MLGVKEIRYKLCETCCGGWYWCGKCIDGTEYRPTSEAEANAETASTDKQQPQECNAVENK